MRLLAWVVALILFAQGPVVGRQAGGKGDADALQGTWETVSFVAKETQMKKWSRFTISGSKVEGRSFLFPLRGKTTDMEGARLKLDATKNPKEIDVVAKNGDTILKGIYELKGDILRVAVWPDAGPDGRAQFFSDKQIIFTFKKRKVLAPDKAKQARAALQGDWDVIEVVDKGKKEPLDKHAADKKVTTFKGNKIIFAGSDKADWPEFDVDPGKSPAEIDLDDQHGLVKGIYELKGDVLRIAIRVEGDRPRSFAEPDIVVTKFKKRKASAPDR